MPPKTLLTQVTEAETDDRQSDSRSRNAFRQRIINAIECLEYRISFTIRNPWSRIRYRQLNRTIGFRNINRDLIGTPCILLHIAK